MESLPKMREEIAMLNTIISILALLAALAFAIASFAACQDKKRAEREKENTP